MQKPDLPPTSSMVDMPKMLFVKECAEMLRLTYQGMWSIINSGEGPPHIKIRNAVRIPEDEFRKWLNSKKRG